MNRLFKKIGGALAHYLNKCSRKYEPFSVSDPATLRHVLRPGDVLLVEGNRRISVAIKYVTQSTWSHAALYVGDALADPQVDAVVIASATDTHTDLIRSAAAAGKAIFCEKPLALDNMIALDISPGY